MSDPAMIEGIMSAVTIPVMAKARIGHFVEAQVLEALGVDYIDESEVLTPADETNHIDKHAFKVPFVCGCRNLGEALRRINEGAAMMRTKGEAGTGNVVEAVRQLRDVLSEIRKLQGMREDELFVAAKELQAPYELVKQVAADGKLPVVNFVAGRDLDTGRRRARHAARLGGRLRRLGIFKSEDPAGWRTRSSRRRPTSTTPRSSPTSRRVSGRRCEASRWKPFRSRNASRSRLVGAASRRDQRARS
jgi:pyridoxal 5'-phosphate synthase pdxS subunit